MLTERFNQAGTPRNPFVVRLVNPSVQVLIDLGAMYGHQPHFPRPNILWLPALHLRVVGQLDAWLLTDTGWFGACQYHVKLAHGVFVEQEPLRPELGIETGNGGRHKAGDYTWRQ